MFGYRLLYRFTFYSLVAYLKWRLSALMKEMSGPLQKRETAVRRKEVRHCLLHPELLAGHRAERRAASTCRGMSWTEAAENDEAVACLSPPFSGQLCRAAGRSEAPHRRSAGFIYRSIFSPSRAQLYLTNMSS